MDNIPKPEITPAFTIEDIHKIREWNERRKGMTSQEINEDTNRRAAEFQDYLESLQSQELV